jgi:hypothetical protein
MIQPTVPLGVNWQKLIAAILENLPAILKLVTDIIDAITNDTDSLDPQTKAALAALKDALKQK